MRIIGLKTTLFEHKLPRTMGDANSPKGRNKAGGCLIEISTDEGITGISMGGSGAIPQINLLYENILKGSDPRNVTGLWKKMVEKNQSQGRII